MLSLARTDNSVIAHWWWTIDRWMLFALAALIALGSVLTMAASPAVAERIGLEPFHFARRQIGFLLPAVLLIFFISLLTPRSIRRLAALGFLATLLLMVLTLVLGHETKGATRWLSLAGLSLQPSEFAKPFFVVVTAWMLAEQRRHDGLPGNAIAAALLMTMLGVLAAQPDFGMAALVASTFACQLFIAGLPYLFVAGLAGLGVVGAGAAYNLSAHVRSRIDRFLNPESGDGFQIEQAMQAFGSSGWFGRGPGDGIVKRTIPDAHTDFIFAVAAEEFGLVLCLVIVLLFAFIALRGLLRIVHEDRLFTMLAAGGLLAEFGLQAVVNIGVNLHLLPTKGMTLPFLSYGGSSLLALAIAMGMLLALTRRHQDPGDLP
ncbi:MAG: putative lipid II flippase FtsW [Alphaproteobacteria bacterium]|nr:putative lipid II flippase FtsW [Alphaproteobacteria bacterium]